jgi:hypothetical protein
MVKQPKPVLLGKLEKRVGCRITRFGQGSAMVCRLETVLLQRNQHAQGLHHRFRRATGLGHDEYLRRLERQCFQRH